MSGIVWMIPEYTIFQSLKNISLGNKNFETSPEGVTELCKVANTPATSIVKIKYSDTISHFMLNPPGVKVYAISPKDTNLEKRKKLNSFGCDIQYLYKKTFKSVPEIIQESNFYDQIYAQDNSANSIQKEIRNNTPLIDMYGDGTVPWLSLHVPDLWKKGGSRESKHPVSNCNIPIYNQELKGVGYGHKSIIDVPVFWDYLTDIILQNTYTTPHPWTKPTCSAEPSGQPIPSGSSQSGDPNCKTCHQPAGNGCLFMTNKGGDAAYLPGAKQGKCQVLCDSRMPGSWPSWHDACPSPGKQIYCPLLHTCYRGSKFS